jgi:hypothetical protein
MTVGELKAILKDVPDDVTVIYELYSQYAPMLPEHVRYFRAEDKKIVWREQWSDGFMDYRAEWFPEGETPDFRTVVIFPGN